MMSISNKNKILNTVTQICHVLDLLQNNINKINKKISDISALYYKMSLDTSLQICETFEYLKFQIDLLKSERSYYQAINDKIKQKFIKDVYKISESILMLLCSVENINIENNKEKDSILKKINTLKKYKNSFETSEILEIVNSILSNLDITKEFIDVFNKYIGETIAKNKRENLHCNNFKINMENKKQHILLEYQQFYSKIDELVNYFLRLTEELDKQLKHQKLLDCLVNKNEDE